MMFKRRALGSQAQGRRNFQAAKERIATEMQALSQEQGGGLPSHYIPRMRLKRAKAIRRKKLSASFHERNKLARQRSVT